MPHLAQDDRPEMQAHAHAQWLVEFDRQLAIERAQGHGHARAAASASRAAACRAAG